jgi:tryptophan synthase beta subunit
MTPDAKNLDPSPREARSEPALDRPRAAGGTPATPSAFRLPTRYGPQGLGGCYAPETLMEPLLELEAAFLDALADPAFMGELQAELRSFAGRPTPLTPAPRLAREVGLKALYLKREDQAHTGAHKINNALAQALLARRMGKREILAETGAGQHGVATAAACARLGLDCTVYMGSRDMARQAPNVARMKLFGARVVPVEAGQRTLKEAVNEALRAWAARCDRAHYILGSALGPHPFPLMVRTFQSVIGREARAQALEAAGALPDAVVACAGGGSNALGLLTPFRDDPVRLVIVEGGGHGDAPGEHAARTFGGRAGVLHGCKTLLLQDGNGWTCDTASISAGLDYPSLGPELAALVLAGRVDGRRASDREALAAAQLLARTEGILPALESSHALAHLPTLAAEGAGTVLLGLSGRGDKDLATFQAYLEL